MTTHLKGVPDRTYLLKVITEALTEPAKEPPWNCKEITDQIAQNLKI
jgi:hypothetical protein